MNNNCVSTVDNDASKYSVCKNTVRSEAGDVSATETSDIPILDSGYYRDKSITWSDFVVSVDSDMAIEYQR